MGSFLRAAACSLCSRWKVPGAPAGTKAIYSNRDIPGFVVQLLITSWIIERELQNYFQDSLPMDLSGQQEYLFHRICLNSLELCR
ncbi:uncharacterized protein oxld1 isoform X2 [Scyliorhinus canicula]|uniref:uncharacterized protein oxld1 isoform X2 n=1 Tax=Scyliorhinus canicula TaxID=7830 RepID=UPI0018F3FCD2|nr:uncharacterized protein oxld1 isoform X2 [Scyliorhinus canicula]